MFLFFVRSILKSNTNSINLTQTETTRTSVIPSLQRSDFDYSIIIIIKNSLFNDTIYIETMYRRLQDG
jgi:hypothetical protein